jgi:hypothetical protein
MAVTVGWTDRHTFCFVLWLVAPREPSSCVPSHSVWGCVPGSCQLLFAVLTDTSRGLPQIVPRLGHLRFLITLLLQEGRAGSFEKNFGAVKHLYGSLPAVCISKQTKLCQSYTKHVYCNPVSYPYICDTCFDLYLAILGNVNTKNVRRKKNIRCTCVGFQFL